jgi:hypothetical protein
MLNPFGMGNVRGGLGQAQSNQPYNFKGLEDRLGKLETGIAGLTDQFKNFQIPGQQTVDPIYTGGTEPNPLAPATPTGGISSLPEAQDTGSVPPPTGGIESLAGAPSNIGAVADVYGGGYSGLEPQPTSSAPTPVPGGGGGQSSLGRYMTYQPGQEGFTPLTAEQFASQQDLFGQRQDYTDFSNMAAGIAGIDTGRYRGGANPAFGHAYEAWQGADQSQGMENFLQNYNFDLSPQGPQGPNRHEFMQEFQAANPIGLDTTGTSTWYNTYGQPVDMDAVRDRNKNQQAGWQQTQAAFESSPEYLQWQQERDAWQQREEGRGPLSQSTIQAMGGQQHTGRPDIDPFISMGLGSPTATPTYEGYMDMVNNRPNRPNFSIDNPRGNDLMQPIGGPTQPRQQQVLQGGLGSLKGPTQQKIKQGYQV